MTQNFSIIQTSMIAATRVFEVIDNTDYEPEQLGKVTEIKNGRLNLRMLLSLLWWETERLKEY